MKKFSIKDRVLKNCVQCGNEFFQKRRSQIYCTDRCGTINWNKNTIRNPNIGLPSGTVGAITELFVSAELMKRGYEVYRALSPSCDGDIIAIKNNELHKIEIRSGYYYLKTSTGEYKLTYPKAKINGKKLIVMTHSDNKIHFIGCNFD